ncbi:MAG: histone deacetylase [Candidatus Neomarinimicrobiota bacterium]|nr:MAG: histone deacetylase [Candidatus Neomarinimicrobiota bacterium]
MDQVVIRNNFCFFTSKPNLMLVLQREIMIRYIFSVLLLIITCVKGEPLNKVPIIYSPKYNIILFGIQKLHPFDTEKYKKVYKCLRHNVGIKKDQFYTPEKVSDEDLKLVHTDRYLKSLNNSKVIAQIAEVPILKFIPNILLRKRLLIPMKYGTGGTILGTELALKYGWAINLSGGYHHAKSNSGGGFSFYADIPIAIYKLWQKDPTLKVMIIDLDAHQGNGYESVLKNDDRIVIVDVYNCQIYPRDYEAKQYITYDFPIVSYTKDDEYLSIIDSIRKIISIEKPNLIIYNAGTDIDENDPLGRLKISEEGTIKRDEIVFESAKENNVPILMLLSGGYSKQSAIIISKSIENILTKIEEPNHSLEPAP